jgi:DNA-binding MarR family transcriptional regulator
VTAKKIRRGAWSQPYTGASGQPGHPVLGNVLALTHVVSNHISRAFDNEIEGRYDLSLSEWRVMLTLAHEPGATAVVIINNWTMDKMAVSRAVSKLEARGLIRRKQNTEDRRSYSLSLTARGRKTYDGILPYANQRYHELLEPLNTRELDALKNALEKLNRRAIDLSEVPSKRT